MLVSDCTVGVARVAQLSKETLNQCEIDLLHAADSGVVGGVHLVRRGAANVCEVLGIWCHKVGGAGDRRELA